MPRSDMTGGKRSSKRSGRRRSIWSLQRVRPYCARRSACKVEKSSPGQTIIASASIGPRLVSSLGGGGVDRGLAQKGHLEVLTQPSGELGDRLARFDARLGGAIERAGELVGQQTRAIVVQFTRLDETAFRAHARLQEGSITARASGRRAIMSRPR